MASYLSEKYQLGIVTHFLKAKDIDYKTEARVYSIPIDILGVQRHSTIAIELKSRDFGRGLRQADRNSSLVDYSFLSVWEENVTDHLLDRMNGSPIGLLAVDEGVKCLSPPQQSSASEYAKNKVRKRVSNNV